MPTRKDPDGIETKHLFDLADIAGATILEVGAGDGRLTWRYAAAAGHVISSDPKPAGLQTARQDMPPALRSKVSLAQIKAEAIPFPHEKFDLAIFAWSL